MVIISLFELFSNSVKKCLCQKPNAGCLAEIAISLPTDLPGLYLTDIVQLVLLY